MYENFTRLPSLTRITDSVLEDQHVENLIDFFNWGLLGVGGFFNVKRPSSKSKFSPIDTVGKVWEVKPTKLHASTGNWVWESGIDYPYQPTTITGVWINNTFSPLSPSDYYVNYRDGQIVFNTAKPASTVVEMEYAQRRFNFYDSDHDWFQQVVFDPISDDYVNTVLATNRIYLPAIIIEVVPGGKAYGLQLGDYSRVEEIPILFHILADRDEDRNKMVRVFKELRDRTIILYDTNKVADANRFAMNNDGSVNPDAYTYPDLLEHFAWKRARIINVELQESTPQLPLFRAIVKINLEIIMP